MSALSASPADAGGRASRRGFLATLARSAALAGAAPAAHALASGGAGKPPLIDTHMHVWADDARRFPFAHPYEPGFKPPRLAATVGTLVREMDASAVTHC